MSLDDIIYIIGDIPKIEPLTNVIEIKCNDEIILASDSQLTADQMKTLSGSKLFKINNFVAIALWGIQAEISFV